MKRWEILSELWRPFTQINITGRAAAASFYILVSLLPAAALGLTIFSLLPIPLSDFLEVFLPQRFHPLIEYILTAVTPRNPTALLSVGALLTLWSAAKGIMAVSGGLSVILETKSHRGFIRRRLDAMASFLLLSIVLISTLTIHVFGQWFVYRLTISSPQMTSLWTLLYRFRHLYSILILTTLLAFLYWMLPGRPMSLSSCYISGLFSSVGWMSTSAIFSVYVNQMQSYQRLYGGLGLLLLGCIWLQICMSVLLYSVLLAKLIREKSYHPFKIIKKAF